MFGSTKIWCGSAIVVATAAWGWPTNVLEAPTHSSHDSPVPQIAFASHRDGNWEIYVSDADGENQKRLTNTPTQDRFPLWSPDRTKIAFGSEVGGDHWELWVMNSDGSNPRFLATQIVAKGLRAWSRDGNTIVFSAKVDGDIEILSVDVASAKLTRLTNSPGDDSDPCLSPDGTQLTFSSMRDGNSEIYVARADGTQPRRLTNHSALDRSPEWSPDGLRIAFISTRDESSKDAYIVRVDNGQVERLTSGANATNDGAHWSPDGKFVAVQSANEKYDIQLVRMTDRDRKTLAGSPAYDGQFAWSPLSDQLTFISGRDGFNAVYVSDLTGKVRRLTSTDSLDPEWR